MVSFLPKVFLSVIKTNIWRFQMIKVVDTIMGSGKSSWARQFMSNNPDRPFIYIAPYNTEVEETQKQCPDLHMYSGEDKQKFRDFKKFLKKGENIGITHQCFKMIDDEVRSLLEGKGYTLIIDETLELVIDMPIAPRDVTTILTLHAKVENDLLVWTDNEYPEEGGRFSDIMKMARSKGLMVSKGNMLLWLFPADIFNYFREVYVLTYLF